MASSHRYGDLIPRGHVTDYFEWLPESNKLGTGTYGTVSKAKCIKKRTEDGMKEGEFYAVKVLKKDRLKDDRHWRAIIQEMEILRRIQSPYCIQLYDAFQSDTAIYLVLEYIDGGELFEFIIQRGHLTEQEAMLITRQLLEALRFLHCEQKIVHRDLKPENILMVKDSMQIKLIDFGFAKFFGQPSSGPTFPITPNPKMAPRDMRNLSPGATIPNTPSDLVMSTPIGSLKYCAPEVLKRLETHGIQARVTTRVDIQKLDMFAAGVVTYVMLGGSFPFSSKNRQTLAQQIDSGITFPDSRFKDVSETAKSFCRYMLHPDRKRRPLSWEALNHPWLRAEVPATPLESWRGGCEAPSDNAVFDVMRELEKAQEQAEQEEAKTTQIVAPRTKDAIVQLRPPKKGATKKSPTTSSTLFKNADEPPPNGDPPPTRPPDAAVAQDATLPGAATENKSVSEE